MPKILTITGYVLILVLLSGNFYWTYRIAGDVDKLKAVSVNVPEIVLDQKSADKPAPAPIVEKTDKYIDISVDENGFSPSMFQVYADEKIELAVKNNGKIPHSLKIAYLDINSGAIEPGKTANLVINKVPQISKNINFTSGTEGDNGETFAGIIMIIER